MTQFYANNFKVELLLKDSYTTSLAFSFLSMTKVLITSFVPASVGQNNCRRFLIPTPELKEQGSTYSYECYSSRFLRRMDGSKGLQTSVSLSGHTTNFESDPVIRC